MTPSPLTQFLDGQFRLGDAAFAIGDKVLELLSPWNGASTVTACELQVGKRGSWWLVTYQSPGVTPSSPGITTARQASDLIAAPKDWIDPPVHPVPSIILPLTDYGRWPDLKEQDIAYQAELAVYRRDYAGWAQRYLAPLGFSDHARLAAELAAACDALSMAAE